jgi:hypothetical protein
MPKHRAPVDGRLGDIAILVRAAAPPQPAPGPAAGPASARRRWPTITAMALGFLLVGGAVIKLSAAQRRDALRIIVAPTIVAAPASQASLPIQVGPPDALPSNSFVRLRGFPASVSLTEGHAIAPGAWAIPLFGLATLKAIVPAGVSGRTEIHISLVGVDGTTLAESHTSLVIAANTPDRLPPEPSVQPQRPIMTPPPAAKRIEPAPALTGEEMARAERLLAQGSKHFEQGNIGAARMFFQRAAEAGLAEGAIKMGSTYDPVDLATLGPLVGVSPDRNEARKWYERARELGAPEAEGRLGRLSGR